MNGWKINENGIRWIALSMSHSTPRLPEMHITSDKRRKIRPVGSNWRKGTNGLQRNVKMGEKRNSGMVFLPRNNIRQRNLAPIWLLTNSAALITSIVINMPPEVSLWRFFGWIANNIKARMATEEDWNRFENERPLCFNIAPARKYKEQAKDKISTLSEIR